MRKQYKFIKHSKTDRYKSLKPADIESATTKLQFQSSYAVYHKPSRSEREGKPIPYKILCPKVWYTHTICNSPKQKNRPRRTPFYSPQQNLNRRPPKK